MAIELEPRELSQSINDKIKATDNGLFLLESGEELTAGDLMTAVNYHRSHFYPKYKKEHDYYVGRHDIADPTLNPPKEHWKPDNRVVYNFPRKAVTSFNGFFIGTPVNFTHEDNAVSDEINDWVASVDLDDVDAEVSKMSSMYGKAYYFIYQDSELNEDGIYQTLVAPKSPMHTFLIYDANSFKQKVHYGVTYRWRANGDFDLTLYDAKGYYTYTTSDAEGVFLDAGQGFSHPFGMVPIIEAPENEERMALCEDIVSLIDEVDKAMSEKSNDVDYFSDAYLVLKNTYLNKEDLVDIRDNRVINISGEGAASADANFLAKPSADETQENLLNRLIDAMYQISNVVNLNDESFAGNVSGVALQMKFQAMQDMARTKSLKFRKALRAVLRCVANAKGYKLDLGGLDIHFTQSIPHNLTEEANFVNAFYGKIPTPILYQQLSFIQDPNAAFEQLKEEQMQNALDASDMLQSAMSKPENGQSEGVKDNAEPRNSEEAD